VQLLNQTSASGAHGAVGAESSQLDRVSKPAQRSSARIATVYEEAIAMSPVPLLNTLSFNSLSEASTTLDMDCPEVRIDIPTGQDNPFLDRLLQPPAPSEGTIRCRVHRDSSKNSLDLHIEEGNVFVLSAARSGKDWLIYDQPSSSTGRKHVVRLRGQKKRAFSLIRGRDEHQANPPELLAMRHTLTQLAEELPELNVVEAIIPTSVQGASGGLIERMDSIIESRLRAGDEYAILQSRKPKWNARTDTYELPFAGRANQASARNFQLIDREGGESRVVLLYGKLGDNEFALDIARPISLLHAFSVVLSTSGW